MFSRSTDNVDYDEIKQFIKENTRKENKTSPVGIPGQVGTEESRSQFEDELYDILKEQHQRINLFIKSKYGEIERRIGALRYQLRQLVASKAWRPYDTQKYTRLGQEANNVGGEIQSLSRYVSTQRMAFRKLLKKYRKWTGSTSLEVRFDSDRFPKIDAKTFVPQFDQILSSFAEIQTLLKQSWRREQKSSQLRDQVHDRRQQHPSLGTSLVDIQHAFKQGKVVEFDARFSMIPTNRRGGTAKYWIHNDNLFEVRVRLLREMEYSSANSNAPIVRQSSGGSLANNRIGRSPSTLEQNGAFVQSVIVDDLDRVRRDQKGATVGLAEYSIDSSPTEAALVVSRGSGAEAAIVARRMADWDVPSIICCDRSEVSESLPNLEAALSEEPSSIKNLKSTSKGDIQKIKKWLAQHPKNEPLASITSRRSRLQGLHSDVDSAFWAILDTNVRIEPRKARSELAEQGAAQQGASFPHATLEIRWEGKSRRPEIVKNLDESHLAERIRGFSTEAYAIYVLYTSWNSAPPVWAPLLEHDIRKLPPKQDRRRFRKDRSALTTESSTQSSAGGPASSVFSAGAIQSSATSIGEPDLATADEAAARSSPKHFHKTNGRKQNEPSKLKRYWNEFDDEEHQRNEYTVLVDPDASSPGVELLSSIFHRAKSLFSRDKSPDNDEENARKPLLSLLNNRDTSSTNDDDDDSSSEETVPHYGTISKAQTRARSSPQLRRRHRTSRRRRRERTLLHTYLACYIVALLLLLASSLLEAYASGSLPHKPPHKSPNRNVANLHAAAAVGVGFSLVFACVGTLLVARREDRLSWAHRVAGWLGLMVVVGWGVGLVVVLGNAV